MAAFRVLRVRSSVLRLPTGTISQARAAGLSSSATSPTVNQPKETVKTKPSKEELDSEEAWMQKEIIKYYKGRNLLAKLMGREPETFTEKDVQEAVRYLLPSSLTAKDARPFLKHPSEVFPKRKESAFDSTGRPLESGFYTGSPAYHNLIHEIYECTRLLESSAEEKKRILERKRNSSKSSSESSKSQSDSAATGVLAESGSDLTSDSQESSQSLSKVDSNSPKPSDSSETISKESKASSPSQSLAAEKDEKTQHLETEEAQSSRSTPMQWVKKDTMSNILAEELTDDRYKELVSRLTALADHPDSSVVNDFLNQYRKPHFKYSSQAKLPTINKDGYAYAVGRRKTAVAQIWLKKGLGSITVNNMTLNDYFPQVADRQQALYPLMLINQLGKWDVEAKLHGGGTTGQAGAIRHGISKALLAFKSSHSDILERAGLLIRDPRMVERKKPGQKKARKKFAWVKR